MNKEARIKCFYFFALLGVLIAIDQLSKYLIRHFGGFYICNPDISWSFHISSYIFWILWVLIIVALLLLLLRKELFYISYCIIFIISGAISNVIDRLYFGCVIDFIVFHFWPIFNLADIFIVTGTLLLLVKWKKILYNK